MEHIHLIGIGGTGLSAIARVLLERGYRVSGSDLEYSELADSLLQAGALIHTGHEAENVRGADIVIRSSAVPDDNVEVQEARERDIPVVKRAEFLPRLTEGQKLIAVAGSHGKTTTTAMLSWILMELDQDPSFIVGGVVENLHTNARAGNGEYFVIEADEYDEMFLGLEPEVTVVTNVEYDHPDYYATPQDFEQAFRAFVGRLKSGGSLVLCAEDPGARDLRHEVDLDQDVYFYGFDNPDFNYMARNLQRQDDGGYRFDFYTADIAMELFQQVQLGIPGEHNVLNALAALGVVDVLGLSVERATAALADFQGSGRRFDIRGKYAGVVIVDDYAHHPTEIRTTIRAAKDRYPEQDVWVVWQPHTYSRTLTLQDGFSTCFQEAEHVVVTAVYPSREEKPEGFSMPEIVRDIDHGDISYQAEFEAARSYLVSRLAEGDVVLIFSAGDAVDLSADLARTLSQQDR